MALHVASLDMLALVAENRKAVVVPTHPIYRHRLPAAFVLNFSGSVLVHLFRQGMFVYEKKEDVKRG